MDFSNKETPMNNYQIEAINDILYAFREQLLNEVSKLIDTTIEDMRADVRDKMANMTKYG